jgi:metallo-beta-lactamase family protein
MKTAPTAPRHVFINHGEANAADALRVRIGRELHWEASVPLLGQQVELAGL